MPEQYIVTVQEDTAGDCFFELPQQLIEDLGLHIGDRLVWSIHEDGSVTMKKKEER
ncbi:AbrB/MazE/SpoVT family DNA-binding domain-containing protein [Photobacterium sp. ZSDE20]|uniref:AbrB/MazE/SpoVT family DNA-binding domain-containing protein n=1 Tax=Photobacterium pectinilyticum TaxID=2906793 RepID=A0ABT1N8N4_9GAMM|nr:AbrB/MazE/SpoVT family DNA-binding domain-containing protein [Photobacterium sp. ZSDE20]MCQ1061086.1 AbrB/MazE/SpoVT family DNA-binding domain-containing protein [Photobacterium sp. ZSDE20]MDD1826195.1 AbrB/MazE/SpoVT family DNA-binding domain-containing protein [Photobacterium sp. ZSDE20]